MEMNYYLHYQMKKVISFLDKKKLAIIGLEKGGFKNNKTWFKVSLISDKVIVVVIDNGLNIEIIE